MNCKECYEPISQDDVTIQLNSSDLELYITCPHCNQDYGVCVNMTDFEKI